MSRCRPRARSGPAAGACRRSRLPEVLQTSALDCGPAALAAGLRHIGIPASYEALRDLCATDVDGTSIDTMEAVAVALGADATQMVVPVEHLLALPEEYLPAIAVTLLPDGFTHFVLIGRVGRRRVEVMDPAGGRRWVSRDGLAAELYRHPAPVPAEGWRAWAGSDVFTTALLHRMATLGVSDRAADELVTTALADPGVAGLATLDAAIRHVSSRPRPRPRDDLAAAIAADLADGGRDIPHEHWSCVTAPTPTGSYPSSASASGGNPSDSSPAEGEAAESPPSDTVTLRGAVIVRLRAGRPGGGDATLLARVTRVEPGPWVALARALPEASTPVAVLAALATFAGVATVVEAVALRPLVSGIDGADTGATNASRALAALTVSAVAVIVTLAAALARGRQVEGALRRAWWDAVALLPEGFTRTRPASDLAERGHLLHRLRELPLLGARLTMAAAVGVAAATVMVVAAPASAPAVAALVAVVVGGSALAARRAAEVDLRVRTLGGCLTRPIVDALRASSSLAHRPTAAALRHEHDRTLTEWSRALGHQVGITAGARAAVTATAALALTWALVLTSTEDPARLLLVLVCGLTLTEAGAALVDGLRTVPIARSVAARIAGPLAVAAPKPSMPDVAPSPEATSDRTLRFDRVAVVRGDRPLLQDVDLTVPAGTHVAVVGPSGAGKTTLLELAAGLVTPTSGDLWGVPRPEEVAWSTPDTRLWNTAIAANLDYGSADDAPAGAERMGWAEIVDVTERADRRSTADIGDGGGLLSDGEGQRVRLARAMGRPSASLVVLDETFRGLERARRRRLLDRVREIWPESTVLCALHDVDDAATLDLVVVVEGGQVVEVGPPDDLAADPESRFSHLVAAAADHGLDGWREHPMAAPADPAGRPGKLAGSRHAAVPSEEPGQPPGKPVQQQPEVPARPPEQPMQETCEPARRTKAPMHRPGAPVQGRDESEPAEDDGLTIADRPRPVRPTGGRRPRRIGAATSATLLHGTVAAASALAATALVADAVAALGGAAYRNEATAWSRIGFGLVAAAALVTLAVAAGGRLGIRLGVAYRRRAMERALDVDPDRARALGTGRTLAVAIDAELVGSFLVTTGANAVLALAEVTVALALTRRSVVPGTSLGVLAIALATIPLISTILVRRRERWSRSRQHLTGRLVERLIGIDTIRLQDDRRATAAEADRDLAAHHRAGRSLDRAGLALAAVPAVTVVSLAGLVLSRVGEAAPSMIAASLGIALLAGSGLDRIATVAGDTVGAIDAHRGLAVLDSMARTAPPPPGASVHRNVLLSAEGVTATFDEGRSGLVTPNDLVLHDGDRVVLTGPSGCGKTTFGEVLAGHRRPSTGRLATAPGSTVARVASAGDAHIFSASLLFNLCCAASWPPDDDDLDHIDQVIEDVGLTDLVARMPGGLSQPLGDGGWRISAGEAARVALARALVARPDVVILDETTGPLDAATRDLVLAAVERHSRATLLIAHV